MNTLQPADVSKRHIPDPDERWQMPNLVRQLSEEGSGKVTEDSLLTSNGNGKVQDKEVTSA